MTVEQMKEVLSKLDDESEILCCGNEIEIIIDYDGTIVIDEDHNTHLTGHDTPIGPCEGGELIWEQPWRVYEREGTHGFGKVTT